MPLAFVGTMLMMSIGYAMCNSVGPAMYAEMFDTRVRYTGVAMAGQLGQIFPGFAPAIAAAIVASGGGGTEVSLFVAVCCLVSLIVVTDRAETRDVATQERGGLRDRPAVTPAEASQEGSREKPSADEPPQAELVIDLRLESPMRDGIDPAIHGVPAGGLRPVPGAAVAHAVRA